MIIWLFLLKWIHEQMKKETLDKEIVIRKEIKDLIIPLSKEEYNQLENNIIAEGCREALVVWNNGGQCILVDGHNRYRICQKHNIPFKVLELELNTLDDIKVWMLNNQLGRRNLNPDQLSYYRGLKYISLKKKKGGFENVKSKGQNELSTAESLSQEFNVSESTIKRDAKYAEGLEVITKSNPSLRNKILTGEAKFKKSDIALLTQSEEAEPMTFKNAADLHNKLNVIKDVVFHDIEKNLKDIEEKKVQEAREILSASEPLFQAKDDRIHNIKGRIISMMNRAIRDKDLAAIVEMKNLIDKLEYLISTD